MSIFKAYRIWKEKKENSDFTKIKVSSSGAFQMKSGDLFNDKEKMKKYVEVLNNALNIHNKSKFVQQE